MLDQTHSEESPRFYRQEHLTLLAKSQLTVTVLPIVLPAAFLFCPGVVVPLTLLPTATIAQFHPPACSQYPVRSALVPCHTPRNNPIPLNPVTPVCIRLFHDTSGLIG